MQIKTNKESNFGIKIKLPIDGVVEIDNNGIVEVSEDCGNLMVEQSPESWEIVESKSKTTPIKKKVVEESEENPADENSERVEGSETSNMDGVIEELKSMKLPELIDLVKKSNHPETEWIKYKSNKLLLTNYIIKKLQG
jgi:hypothetical protein